MAVAAAGPELPADPRLRVILLIRQGDDIAWRSAGSLARQGLVRREHLDDPRVPGRGHQLPATKLHMSLKPIQVEQTIHHMPRNAGSIRCWGRHTALGRVETNLEHEHSY